MSGNRLGGIGSALAWMVFPLVPVTLGVVYYQTINLTFGGPSVADPRDWDWFKWVSLLGPLVGYGFLAGATVGLPDDPARRGWRGWLSRRSLWVAVGPWMGFLVCAAVFWALVGLDRVLSEPIKTTINDGLTRLGKKWTGWALSWALGIAAVVILSYAWLLPAFVALRRARRNGRGWRAFQQGLATALAFVGSLFGSFWAITEGWRSFFFDPKVIPAMLAATSLFLLCGCGGPITYGEVRRRELFDAMLPAWLLGLALVWRWWARPRSKTPGA